MVGEGAPPETFFPVSFASLPIPTRDKYGAKLVAGDKNLSIVRGVPVSPASLPSSLSSLLTYLFVRFSGLWMAVLFEGRTKRKL